MKLGHTTHHPSLRHFSGASRPWDTNTLGLARGGDLEEVGVDASGGDRRARAGTLDHERLRRVTRRVEGDDVVGVLGAREGVRLRVLAQLDRALLAWLGLGL